MITEDQVHDALEYLNNNIVDAAKARAEYNYVDNYRKVLLAKLMKQSANFNTSAAAQERDALADPQYEEHLEAIKQAEIESLEHFYRRDASKATIDAWQTQEATSRAQLSVR